MVWLQALRLSNAKELASHKRSDVILTMMLIMLRRSRMISSSTFLLNSTASNELIFVELWNYAKKSRVQSV